MPQRRMIRLTDII